MIEKREQQEYETLTGLLEMLEEGPVRQALINTWSNIEMIWRTDGETALNHHGKVLTAEERNRLQHVTNGNIKDVTKRRGHQAMTTAGLVLFETVQKRISRYHRLAVVPDLNGNL